MSTLYNLFIDIGFIGLLIFIIKILIIPLLFLLLYWTILVIWLHFEKNKDNYLIYVHKIKLKSLISTLILLGVYLGFLIKFNGIHHFNFLEFPFNTANTYFLLLPIFISYIVIIFLYFNINKNIKSLLK